MYISKLLLNVTYILVGILFCGLFNTYEGYIDKLDIITVSLCSLIIGYVNYTISESKAFFSFIIFYFYTLCYLIPITFFAHYPKYYTIWFGKYVYEEYSIAKIFILITVIILLLHLIFRKVSFNSLRKRRIKLNFITRKSTIFSILVLIFYIIFNQYFNSSLIIIFFNIHALAFILMIGIVNQEFREKKYIYTFFTIYILSTIVGGSRGGILNSIFTLFVLLTYFKGNIFLRKKYILNLSYILLIAVLTYPIATFLRYANDNGINFLNITYDVILISNASTFVSGTSETILILISRIIDRLDLFKYSYIIFNDLYDQSFFTANLNNINILKSSINLVLPGDYFDVLASNNFFANLLDDRSLYEIKNDWSSYNLSFFDYNFLRYGKFLGIFTIFLTLSFFLFYLQNLLKIKNISVKIISLYILVSLLKLFVFFGYDYLIRDFIHNSLSIFTYIYFLRLSR